MKLHRLSVTAIGPFAGTVEVDFARLTESGLFLLEGPTGSGKSTVIDAVVFALYGKVAASSADDARLRSHHAQPGTESVVELVFETQSGLYRVRRTPQYDRAKKNGTGTTRQQASVKLWRISDPDDLDGGDLLSNRVGEADRELVAAVGLSREQFVQTVVLPQGEFAAFLRADTKTKKALLQTVFGTEIVARAQLLLVSAKQDAERERAAAAHAIESAVHALAGAAGLTEVETEVLSESARAGTPLTVRAQLAELAASLTAAADQAAALAAGHRDALDALRQHQTVETDLSRRRARRAALLERQSALAAGHAELDAQRARRDDAERAATVVPAATTAVQARDDLDTAVKLDEQARAGLAGIPDLAEVADSGATEIIGHREAFRTQIAELQHLVAVERDLPARRSDLDALLDGARAATAESDRITAHLDLLPDRRAGLLADLATVADAASDLPAARLRLEHADAAVAAAREADAAAAEVRGLSGSERDALQSLEEADRTLSRLRRDRTAMIAAELGSALTDGDPCPVCGSAEHPNPAQRTADHVEESDLDAAEAELARRSVRYRELSARRSDRAARLERLRQASGDLAVRDAESAAAAAAECVAGAEAAARRQASSTAAIAELDADHTASTAARAELQVHLARVQEQTLGMQARMQADEASISAARGGFPTVAARIDRLTEYTALLDDAIRSSESLASCLQAASRAEAELRSALADAGFADTASWSAARLMPAELTHLRASVDSAQAERRDVDRDLADDALTDRRLDDVPIDLDVLALRVADAGRLAEDSAALAATRAETASKAEAQTERIEQALTVHEQVLERTATAIRVGTLAGGGGENQLNMELATYVLIRRFAEVIDAANDRLRRIGSGRFQLEHSDVKRGNSKSGLGLVVHDLHTGVPRDPGTLSGGETFYVSLALALGLADIVRSESGGVDLQTLFIDEGFGSLDPETLDEVLGVLSGLRAGGRAVGVVSHVTELKARIPDRIEVRRNADGSSRLETTA